MTPERGQHGHAADVCIRQQARRADSLAVYPGQRMQADLINRLIPFQLGRHALLFDEHRSANGAGFLTELRPIAEFDVHRPVLTARSRGCADRACA